MPSARPSDVHDILVLVGGPPRVGKTTVAATLGRALGCGWASLDTIRGIVKTLDPRLAEAGAPGASLTEEADRFQPHFAKAASSSWYVHGTYVLEGVGFTPAHVDALPSSINRTAVFLGTSRFDLDAALDRPGRNRWLADSPPEMQAVVPAWVEGWSAELAAQCELLGYPYVDVAGDFDAALQRVVDIVLAS
jgi:hypothetical protein